MSRQPAETPRPADSPYYNEGEAATYLRLQPRTLSKYRAEGTGPRYSKLGDRVVYHRARLDEWARACERVSTTDAPEASR